MAMTAGGSWIKELSTPSFDPSAKPGAGARRATMSLTAGFGLGALLAGCLAEWAPGQTPYLIHILLSVVSMAGLLTVPETRQSAHLNVKGSFWSDIATPVALHPRFLLAVLPIAPWVFGCAGVAYAILPSLTQDKVSIPIAFSAVITMVALTFGFGVQQISDTYLRHGGTRASNWDWGSSLLECSWQYGRHTSAHSSELLSRQSSWALPTACA